MYSVNLLSPLYPTYTYYPRWQRPPDRVEWLTTLFASHRKAIDSTTGSNISDEVLRILRPRLVNVGFEMEDGNASEGQIARLVFFGENRAPSRQYNINAYHPSLHVALEAEAGRAQAGNAIYRDIIQRSLLVDVEYAAVAVPLA